VHCGLCLNQCPTYRALRLEPASPRGRIHLVKAAAEGRIELGDRFKEHMYLCLLCRACETACPSGVDMGTLPKPCVNDSGRPVRRSPGAVELVFTRLLPYPEDCAFCSLCCVSTNTPECSILYSHSCRKSFVRWTPCCPRYPTNSLTSCDGFSGDR
jgi:L-lactate utilization protein LutB